MALQSNAISHWLGANLESALYAWSMCTNYLSVVFFAGPTDAELKREDYIKKNLTTSLADATRHLQLKYVSSDEPIGR